MEAKEPYFTLDFIKESIAADQEFHPDGEVEHSMILDPLTVINQGEADIINFKLNDVVPKSNKKNSVETVLNTDSQEDSR